MMKPKVLAPLALCASFAAVASAEIKTPQVGMIRQFDGTVRTLYGLHANFVHGHEIASSVRSASFSDQGGLIGRRGSVSLLNGEGIVTATYNAEEANPVVSMSGETSSAIAWLPSKNLLLTWDGSRFSVVAVNQLAGSVTGLERFGTSARLLVIASDGSASRQTVDLLSGTITQVEPLPGVWTAVFEDQSYLFFHDSTGLIVESPDGTTRRIDGVPADFVVEAMSTHWLHVVSASAHRDWALHLDGSTFEFSEVPAPPPARITRPGRVIGSERNYPEHEVKQ